MNTLPYSLVIATFERPAQLAETLKSLAAQTRPPDLTVIVDSSHDDQSRAVAESFQQKLRIEYERAVEPSSAKQRNQGAQRVSTPLIGFLDDDTTLSADTFGRLCKVFEQDDDAGVGGVAARIRGMQHTPPRGLLWFYYRLQAGYSHPTYGGKLFGPAINCLPAYTESDGELIPAEWLNSTCVLYRTPLFNREKFPDFHGYSFMEDVHLSARIGKTHKLFFHATAMFGHHDAPSSFKRDVRQMARMRAQNRRRVANGPMGCTGPVFEAKFFLHRLFSTVSIFRNRGRDWGKEILGTWS
jgi:GT2 family glycosyltransferase